MVFCGPTKKAYLGSFYPFVYFTEVTRDKELFYMCVNNAMNQYNHSNIEGYLLLSDDLLFFPWNVYFSKETLRKPWIKKARLNIYDLTTNCHTEGGLKSPTNCNKSFWPPLRPQRPERQLAKKALIEMRDSNNTVLSNCFKHLTEKNGGPFRVNYQWYMGDMFYMPQTIMNEYLIISEVFIRNNLIHALAIPTITKCF